MRPRVLGHEVTAPDIERIPPDIGPHHLVRLGAALIRRELVRLKAGAAALEFSERITVPDQGVDATCTVAEPLNVSESGGLIGPGMTIFQFKYCDVTRAATKSLVGQLARRLRKEARRLVTQHDRYVLMTNLDLIRTEKRRLELAIRDASGCSSRIVVVEGAAEIASRLNESPDLRHLFFGSGSLATQDVVETELRAAYRGMGWPSFVDRKREIAAIASFVADPHARVLSVVGPRYAGKTRLVIEALKASAPTAVWAESPSGVTVDLFRDLDSAEGAPVLVIDRYDGATAPRAREWAGQRERLKTILVGTGSETTGPRSRDELVVSRLADEAARKVLESVAPRLPFALESWVIDASGGLPGLMLPVVTLAGTPAMACSASSGQVHRELCQLITDRYVEPLTPQQRHALEIAALLPVLGVEGSVATDAEAVAAAVGRDPSILRMHLPELERLGLVRRRGRFIEVVPPVLADHLADSVLATTPLATEGLVATLRPGLLRPLLERVSRMPDRAPAAHDLLDSWCQDFETLVQRAELVEVLAAALPKAAAECIARCVKAVPVDELRLRLRGQARRAIVWACENLTLRSESFETAARAILRLGETENETYATNATGVFVSLFDWRRPQITVSLARRLGALREAAESPSAEARRIAAAAAGAAFAARSSVVALRESRAAVPPEPEYRAGTWEEVGQYGLGVLAVLRGLLADSAPSVQEAARKALLESWPQMAMIALRPVEPGGRVLQLAEEGFSLVEEVARSAQTAQARVDVITRLEAMIERLTGARPESAVARALSLRATRLRDDLIAASLRDRLWWWVGPPRWARWRPEGADAESEAALDDLAAALQDRPELLEEHLAWLTSAEPGRASELFERLGRTDHDRRVLRVLLANSEGVAWPLCFASYITGWVQADSPGARGEIDRLIDERPDVSEALLRAIGALPHSERTVKQALRLLDKGSVPRAQFVGLAAWLLRWHEMPVADFRQILAACDDRTPEVRRALLPVFARRQHWSADLPPDLRDVAWEFLGSTCLAIGDRSRDWDDLASQLGKDDPERLLAVVEECLGRRPLEGVLQHELLLVWGTLEKANRAGLLHMLLRLALRQPEWHWVQWTLEELVDASRDREPLMEFARQAGVDMARLIARVVKPDPPAFWNLARDLLAEWDDEQVAGLLSGRPFAGSWCGSAVPMIDERLAGVRPLLSDPELRVATWAQTVVSALEDWRRRAERDDTEEWIWDYRVRRSELKDLVRKPDSPERLWAIGRLLKHAPRERVQELLTPEDILAALPRIEDLDEARRTFWEDWARHWHGRR